MPRDRAGSAAWRPFCLIEGNADARFNRQEVVRRRLRRAGPVDGQPPSPGGFATPCSEAPPSSPTADSNVERSRPSATAAVIACRQLPQVHRCKVGDRQVEPMLGPTRCIQDGDHGFDRRAAWFSAGDLGHHHCLVLADPEGLADPFLDLSDLGWVGPVTRSCSDAGEGPHGEDSEEAPS